MATLPRRSTRTGTSPAARLAYQAAVVFGALAFLAFAIEGGEYSTRELLSRKRESDRLAAEVAGLEVRRNALLAQLDAVANDPATLERIAREEFGMVRGSREILYRFAEDFDSQDRDSAR